MADPFLLAHRAEPLLFDISGRAPISIRDQILRGHYLIRALHRTGGVGPGVRLLIVGAGAAGASAAIEAVKRGVQTVLVEAKPGPFLLQASCSTRWIDPAQYDFVAPHWAGQAWPASGPSGNTPLAFRADWAASIAKAWENTLTSVALARPNLLSLRYGWALAQWPVPQYTSPQRLSHYDVTLGKGPPLQGAPFTSAYSVFSWEQFEVVVLAYGVEADRVVVEDPAPGGSTPKYGPTRSVFKGLRFWDNDAFQQPGLGLGPGALALVSGGGDGALQDFIRLVTGQRSAREVLVALTASLPSTSSNEIELALWHQDEQAHRALLWTVPRDAPTYHAVLSSVHATHVTLVNALFKKHWTRIAGVLDPMRAGRNTHIELAYPCEHFGECYSLNRFVVLLLAEYLRRAAGSDPLAPGHALVRVEHTGTGTCVPGCWGPSHEVVLQTGVSCSNPSGAGSAVRRRSFHGIAVRHGVNWQSLQGAPATSPGFLPHHSLPLQPPW